MTTQFHPGEIFKLEPRLSRFTWIIISDPIAHKDNVIFVPVREIQTGFDDACILLPSEYPELPYLTGELSVYYLKTRNSPHHKLVELFGVRKLTLHGKLEMDTLRKIRDGVLKSNYIPKKFRTVMQNQNLYS